MRIVLIPFVAVAMLAAGACGDDEAAGEGAAVRVVASFYPLAEAARQVGGDRVEVADLTPPGAEPHDLELSPDRVDDLEDADLAVVLGRGFQPAAEQVADRRDGLTLVVLDELGVDGEVDDHGHEEEGEGEDAHEDEEGSLDPHVWLDLTRMAAIVELVEEHLAEVDPQGADVYAANAARYVAELEALDAEAAETLAGCEQDVIVVSHAAFGWLADRYGLRQEEIAGLSPEQEPDPRRLDELVRLVEREGVTTVFTETLVSSRVADTLAREAGVATAVLNPLEGLTRAQADAGADFLSVMRDNIAALQEALGC